MAGRYFDVPFARDGDRVSTPDVLQLDGSVSFVEGFGFDYERPAIDPVTGQPDPLYKPIPRAGWNGLMHDITQAIGIMQQQGVADWTVDAVPYPVAAMVRHVNAVWYSLQDNNSGEPGVSATWVRLPLPSNRYAVGGGSANAYAATYVPALTALEDGTQVSFRVPANNTGASTFAPNGLTAKPIRGLGNLALQGGELAANGTARLQFSTALDCWVLLSCDNAALQIKPAVQSQQAITLQQLQDALAGAGVPVAKVYWMGQN